MGTSTAAQSATADADTRTPRRLATLAECRGAHEDIQTRLLTRVGMLTLCSVQHTYRARFDVFSGAHPQRPSTSDSGSTLTSVPRVISAAELSSIETAVGELGNRVSHAADELMGTPHEDVGVELYEVERSLRMARRRLSQATDALR